MRYILYSPPHEKRIGEIRKTNGEIIPERVLQVGARALYCTKDFPHRRYRRDFLDKSEDYRLLKCKSIAEAESEQKELKEYCGETFEIHEYENGRSGPRIV